MKCKNCSLENQPGSTYCTFCGTLLEDKPQIISDIPEAVAENIARSKLWSLIKDKLYLTICILLTVSAVLSITSGGFNVVTALAAIFSWLLYSKGNTTEDSAKYTKYLSGTTYAHYVIINVSSIIMLISSAILACISAVPGVAESFTISLRASLLTSGDVAYQIFHNLFSAGGLTISIFIFVISILFAIISGATLTLNILGMKKIHRFLKSTYKSVESGAYEVTFSKQAEAWLMVFGVIDGVSALASLSSGSFLPVAANAAALIISSLLVKKYFNS